MRTSTALFTLLLCSAFGASAASIDMTPNNGTPLIGAIGAQTPLSASSTGLVSGVIGTKLYGSWSGNSGQIYVVAQGCSIINCDPVPPPPDGPSSGVGYFDGTKILFNWDFTVAFDEGSNDNFGWQLTFRLNQGGAEVIGAGLNLAPGQVIGSTIYTIPTSPTGIPGGPEFSVINNWFLQMTIFPMRPPEGEYVPSEGMFVTIPQNSIDATGVPAAGTGVPEPGTVGMYGLGLVALAYGARAATLKVAS